MRRGHVPLRTCVGCHGRYPKSKLVRFVSREGGIALGSAEGRGLYICRRQECFDRALRHKGLKGLSGKGPGCPNLGPLREAIDGAREATRRASGGGAIG